MHDGSSSCELRYVLCLYETILKIKYNQLYICNGMFVLNLVI